MDLFADRTSTHWLASNQLRLWFSAFAHLIMSTLQAGVLKGTELEAASIGQIDRYAFPATWVKRNALLLTCTLPASRNDCGQYA